ncbi:MAG: hypothetical protein KC503_08400 [Myxococcales bacterium]|nr:hypothetical protein [Myxococcales bacterium]
MLVRALALAALATGLWGFEAHASPTLERAPQTSPWLLSGGLLLARPANVAQPGTSTGIALGFLRGRRALVWGVQASWSANTEFNSRDTVRNDDLRLRAVGALIARLGRGSLGLALGLGATLVHEHGELSQGEKAQLPGEALSRTAWRLLPAADLQALVLLRVFAGWGVGLSGGPTLHIDTGGVNIGWAATVGVTWQP